MSLIAWYPLNGDTLDYSGNNIYATPYSALLTSDGKIGMAYAFTQTGGDGVNIPNRNFTELIDNYSIALWVNPAGTHYHYNGTFISSGDWNATQWAFGVSQDNTQIDVLGRGFNKWIAYTLPLNTWTHLVCVVKNNISYLYANGIYIGQRGVTGALASNATNTAIARETYAGGYFSFNGKIQDVRIYDHALSEKEIKEIAKAKILHYTFDDFQEPTTNLIVPASSPSLVTEAIGSWSLTKTGYDTFKVTALVDNPTYGVYGNITNGLSTTVSVLANTAITLSCEVVSYKGSLSRIYPSSGGFGSLIGYQQDGNRYSRTITHTANWTHDMMIRVSGAASILAGDYLEIRYLQMEYKNYGTNFTIGSRSGTINDQSGFRNNAILTEATTPQWISDSKIGSGAYNFVSSQSKYISVSNQAGKVSDSITVSAWAYRDNWQDTSSERIISCTEGGGWQLSTNDTVGQLTFQLYVNGAYGPAGIALSTLTSGWHLITGVYDGRYAKLYVDGILKTTVDRGSPLTYNATNSIIIGGEPASGATATSGYWNGKIDDVRIYATALSATDILELYQTRASLDNKGNLYVTELIDNGIGNNPNNKIAYYNWEEGDYSSANKTFNGIDPSHNMTFARDLNYSIKVLQSHNPVGLLDKMVEFKSLTTHYVQYAHPTTYYYFTFDKTKTYRYSQWIYRHANTSTSYGQNCYLGIQGSTVCNLNTIVENTNPYFTAPAMNDSAYMDKWVLQVFYIYPYASTGNPSGGKLYYTNGNSVVSGTSYNWADKTSSHIRQYPMYEYGQIAEGSYVLHYRPRLDLLDGSEPTIEELISCGEHLPLTNELYKKNTVLENGNYSTRSISELGITNGLVAYYPFDKDALDYSGNRNHGIVSGAVLSSGIKGGAYSFDGTNSQITLPSDSLGSSINSFTISLWTKGTIKASEYSYMITRSIDESIGSSVYSIGTNNVGQIYVSVNGLWSLGSTDVVQNSNQWYHIVLVYDGVQFYGYINNILKVTVSTSITNTVSGTYPCIGNTTVTNTTRKYNGIIDEVRIYNRALSAEEVSILYETTAPSTAAMKITKDTVYLKGEFKEVI